MSEENLVMETVVVEVVARRVVVVEVVVHKGREQLLVTTARKRLVEVGFSRHMSCCNSTTYLSLKKYSANLTVLNLLTNRTLSVHRRTSGSRCRNRGWTWWQRAKATTSTGRRYKSTETTISSCWYR